MKRIGYLVIEKCDEYEQPLGLTFGTGLPEKGILEWTDSDRALFPDRKAANSAINRTEHYRLACERTDLPEKKLCQVIPVSTY